MILPKKILFTRAGYEKLPKELTRLQAYREEVLVRLQRAREQGDLSENGAYKAARFELGDTDAKIRRVQHQIKYGVPTAAPTDGTIGVGSKVTLEKQDGSKVSYEIVGTYEADPLKSKISLESPMGLALKGKKSGEKIEVNGVAYMVET